MAMIREPTMMRPATRRLNDGSIGEYALSNGRTVQVHWVSVAKNRRDILVWEVNSDNPSPMRRIENVALGRKTSTESERLLEEFEQLP
jgi:hypothetical protein